MIHVTNKRHGGAGAYVGRPSALGNPFRIGPDGPRDAVIAKYREWLWDKIQTQDEAVMRELYSLRRIHRVTGDLNLVCWCAPEACHADVIKSALEWMETNHFDEWRLTL